MMNTDIMRQIVAEAELGDKDMPTASRAASLWGYNAVSLHDVRYSANAIYVLEQEGHLRFMRLSWSGDHTRTQLQTEMDFLRYLGEQQYPAVQPVPSRQGKFIEEVTNPYAAWYAVMFQAAKGAHVAVEHMKDAHIREWGALLGTMHNHAERYTRTTKPQQAGWQAIVQKYAAWIPGTAPNTRRYLDEAGSWLSSLPANDATCGFIHWDFEPDNLTWDGDQINVMDFDDMAYFWYTADIAFALDDVLEKPASKAQSIIRLFVEGYRSVRAVSEEWIARLPLFIRLMRVFKTARTCHAYTGTHPELDPPWLKEMRHRHTREVTELERQFSQHFTAPLSTGEVEVWS